MQKEKKTVDSREPAKGSVRETSHGTLCVSFPRTLMMVNARADSVFQQLTKYK